MPETEITSEHTCARMGQVLAELADLRIEMGRFKDQRASVEVSGAAPYEVFYQAHTVYRKANRLCTELGLTSVDPPVITDRGRATQADVLRMLDAIRVRLADARLNLRIENDDAVRPELPGPLARESGKTDSDTMTGCLIASRQLNVMLVQPFGSRDGLHRIIQANALCDQMLRVFGSKLGPNPPFERRKRSMDVFGVLWSACETLYDILHISGVTTLEIRRGYAGDEPTDVYDLASLIVSELEHVSAKLGMKELPFISPTTLTVALPSHNYRRARQLQAGLNTLQGLVRAKPEWIRAQAR